MAQATLGQVGTQDQGFVDPALFAVTFKQDVLKKAQNTPSLVSLIRNVSVTNSIGYKFKFTGNTTASKVQDGVRQEGAGTFQTTQLTINYEDRVLASEAVKEIDELVNDISTQTIIAEDMVYTLNNYKEKNIIREIVAGSESITPRTTNGYLGLTVTSDFDNAADILAQSVIVLNAIRKQKTHFKKVNGKGNLYMVVSPEVFEVLLANTEVMNQDWRAVGNYAEGTVLKINGVYIIENNNMERLASDDADHPQSLVDTIAIFFSTEAVGQVSFKEIETRIIHKEDEYQIKIQSSYIAGVKFLKPELCGQLKQGI